MYVWFFVLGEVYEKFPRIKVPQATMCCLVYLSIAVSPVGFLLDSFHKWFEFEIAYRKTHCSLHKILDVRTTSRGYTRLPLQL